jgi:hypothetical protein
MGTLEKPDFGLLSALAETQNVRLTLTFVKAEGGYEHRLQDVTARVHGYGGEPDVTQEWRVPDPSTFPMTVGTVHVIEGEANPSIVTVRLDNPSDVGVLRAIMRLAKRHVSLQVYGDNMAKMREETGYVYQCVVFSTTIGKRKGGLLDNLSLTVDTVSNINYGAVRYS